MATISSPFGRTPRNAGAGANTYKKGGTTKVAGVMKSGGAAKKLNKAAKGGTRPTKPLPKAQVNSAGQAYLKYVPGAVASDTLSSPSDARFSYPYAETNDYAAKRKMLELTYGNEQFNPERRTQTPEEVTGYKQYLNKLGFQKKGGTTKAVGVMGKGGSKPKIAMKKGGMKKGC